MWMNAISSLLLALSGAAAEPPVSLTITRLDCGTLEVADGNAYFSDAFDYPPAPRTFPISCYLIRHGARLMLWDTGVPEAFIASPYQSPQQKVSLKRGLVDQLRELGVSPGQIDTIGISHWHFDHVSQAQRFPQARLLMGRLDIEVLKGDPSPDSDSTEALSHWLTGSGKLEALERDHDVFGDGQVIMLATPGHTPGHMALLVRLASGPVLLSGDLYHFAEQVAKRGVPRFNHNRADTLASMDRFNRIAANLGARVIIQHEPADIGKLPAKP